MHLCCRDRKGKSVTLARPVIHNSDIPFFIGLKSYLSNVAFKARCIGERRIRYNNNAYGIHIKVNEMKSFRVDVLMMLHRSFEIRKLTLNRYLIAQGVQLNCVPIIRTAAYSNVLSQRVLIPGSHHCRGECKLFLPYHSGSWKAVIDLPKIVLNH